ncbi:MAG: S9 family peptidase [Opitutaceae bacterium]|nr:S9 family peptidase [Opitutaceae bacterium]
MPPLIPSRRLSRLLLSLGAALCLGAFAGAEDAPAKEGALNVYLDREPSDVNVQLELMQHEVYAQQVDTAMLLFILQHGSQVKIERVLYPANTADHEMIPGYVFTPAAGIPKGERRPGLLIVHGGFHGSFEWRFFRLVVEAVQRGYVVMFPEYRGSTGYGETVFKNDYGTTDVADVLAAADYLATKEYVNPARLGVLGHSRGGMIAVRLLQKHPQRFQAGVEIAALLDFVAYMSYKPDSRRRQVAAEKTFGGKLPSQNLPAYLEISPINYVPDIRTPLLCLATTGDKIVPVSINTQRLVDLLKAHGKTHDAHIYDNAPGGHSFLFADSAEARDCFRRSFEWLDQYLKP